jgi:acylglycerol lipase
VVLLSGGRRIRPGVYRKPTARAAFRNLMAVALFRSRTWIEYSRQGMLGRDDPLFNFHYSVRFYSSVYGLKPWAIARMLRAGVIDSPYLTPTNSLEIPVLIGVGDQDELFTVDSSRELFDRLGAVRKAFLVIPGGHHASFPPGSWGPVVEWLRGQFGTQPVAASGPVPTSPGRIASPSAGTL